MNLTISDSLKLTLKSLAETSTLVITGTVTDVHSKLEIVDNKEAINTFVTVNVHFVIKGKIFPSFIKIKTSGGIIGSRGMWSTEGIVFNKGEELLLFLNQAKEVDDQWVIKSISGKIISFENNGIRYYDISNIEVYDEPEFLTNKFQEESVILNKIKSYLDSKNGGN